jgi:hypothetical protein
VLARLGLVEPLGEYAEGVLGGNVDDDVGVQRGPRAAPR